MHASIPITLIGGPMIGQVAMQGAPLNESDHCGDPPLLLAAGNGKALAFLLNACRRHVDSQHDARVSK